MPILNRIAEFHEDMTAWRRELHTMPELLFETERTAAFVAERLRAFGVDEIHEGIAHNGMVALIRGQGEGPVIGLRADMDALPIEEVRDLPWKSREEGKMHACGHDGHTTMLLGAARYLAETRNFAGTVALIFQPAEEGGGGARVMLDEGLRRRFGIGRVFGLHNWPGLEVGRIEMAPGPTMAAADHFDVTIRGKGAHAGWPHRAVDPVLVGSAVVQAVQSIVSRSVDPQQAAVVSITRFHSGTTHNVIPAVAELSGTVRSLDEEVRREVAERFRRIVEGVAEAHGATAEIDYVFGYPVTDNDPGETAFALGVAAEVAGAENASDTHVPQMGAEDFSFMLQEIPGAYVFLGAGFGPGLHHPEYDFNDEISPLGASYFARLVERAQPVSR